MSGKNGRPAYYTDENTMQLHIDKFFVMCEAKKLTPTLTGLAFFLDMDRMTLVRYSHKEQFYITIKRAKSRCEAAAVQHLFKNAGQVAGIIFSLKNNYGWEDKTEVSGTMEHTHFIGESINGAQKAGDTRNRIFENAN